MKDVEISQPDEIFCNTCVSLIGNMQHLVDFINGWLCSKPFTFQTIPTTSNLCVSNICHIGIDGISLSAELQAENCILIKRKYHMF